MKTVVGVIVSTLASAAAVFLLPYVWRDAKSSRFDMEFGLSRKRSVVYRAQKRTRLLFLVFAFLMALMYWGFVAFGTDFDAAPEYFMPVGLLVMLDWILIVTVGLFARPKWVIPPPLRSQGGLVHDFIRWMKGRRHS